jgi:hypothetical protein
VYPKLLLGAGVLAVHGVLVACLPWHSAVSLQATATPALELTIARIIFEDPGWDKVPMPEIRLMPVHPDTSSMMMV